MTITITGNAGLNFDLIEKDSDITVGSQVIKYLTPDQARLIEYTDLSLLSALKGTIGTAGSTIVLNALQNVTVSADVLALAKNTAPIVYGAVKMIIFVNTSVNVVTVTPAVSNSFLPASEQVTIPANGSASYVFPAGKTVDVSNNGIKLAADANNTSVEIYIIGERE